MKSLIYAIIVVAFAAYTTQENTFIFGLGERTLNDQFLTKLSQKAGPGPVGNLTLYFNYAKDEQHFTYMNFTSPNGRASKGLTVWKRLLPEWNQIDMNVTIIGVSEFQLDVNVYGYLVSPGVKIP